MFTNINKFERKCEYLRSCLDKYLDLINIHTYEIRRNIFLIHRVGEDLVYDGEVIIPGYFTVNELEGDLLDRGSIHFCVSIWSEEMVKYARRSFRYISSHLECFNDEDMLTAIICLDKLKDLKAILKGLIADNVDDKYFGIGGHEDDEPFMDQLEEEDDEEEEEFEEQMINARRFSRLFHRPQRLSLQVA